MTSMPERDGPGQWGSTQQSARPGQYAGPPPQGAMPGQEQYVPPGAIPGQPQAGPGGQQSWGYQREWVPVTPAETRVTGRRVVQYIIDYILVGIIPGLAYWALDRGHGVLHALGWVLASVIAIVVYLYYWVLRPHGHDGQTFGMQLLGLRVISKNGGPASMAQWFIRSILLIVDTIFFGFVGWITMMCSRYRQRVGDHMARTLVIPAHYGQQFAASPGEAQMGGQPYPGGPGGYGQQGGYGQPYPGDQQGTYGQPYGGQQSAGMQQPYPGAPQQPGTETQPGRSTSEQSDPGAQPSMGGQPEGGDGEDTSDDAR